MLTADFHTDADLGRAEFRPGGLMLEPSEIVSALSALDSGFWADPGGRGHAWHPDVGKFQGLFYWQKHICSMDRERTPQWPVWTTEEEIVEVPLDYALLHDDLPILDLDPLDPDATDMTGAEMATILRPKLGIVEKVGWAEVFYQLVKRAKVQPGWLASRFNVPMDWLGSLKASPVNLSWIEGNKHAWL